MKVLVGAACVAVIAAVAYFFWGEYSRYHDAAASARQKSMAQAIESANALATSGRCDEITTALVNVPKGETLTLSDIPAEMMGDLRSCLLATNLGAYADHQLDRLNVRALMN